MFTLSRWIWKGWISVKNVCVNFIPCYCWFCGVYCLCLCLKYMHTQKEKCVLKQICAYILNISIGSTLHGGFGLPTGIWVGRFTIKSIPLAMYAKSQSDKKLFAGIYMYYKYIKIISIHVYIKLLINEINIYTITIICRHDRKCILYTCSLNDIEDEFYFDLICPFYSV